MNDEQSTINNEQIMHQKDRRKLLAAGFTILRLEFDGVSTPTLKIKVSKDGINWCTWKKFDTKAARDREVQRVLNEEPLMIFD